MAGVLAALCFLTPAASGQTSCDRPVGPDVIVGEIPETTSYGPVGDISAFAIGTTSCNVGNQNLQWVSTTNQHPVIAQNMYRLKDDRFEQIGMSWVKHGFLALTQNICGCGCNGQGGNVLGVGCSDPYYSGLNGQQGSMGTGGLGPRFQVNAHTGAFAFPYYAQGQTGNLIYKRLQVHTADLDPAQNGGGLYFVEGHYVTPDDAAFGNQNNNASHRRADVLFLSGKWTTNVTDTTQRERPAIRAWKDRDPSVQETDIQVPDDGLLILAAKTTFLSNGLVRYEYALHNLNSDRSAGSFSIPLDPVASVPNAGFHDVDYHDGDGDGGVTFDGVDWTSSIDAGAITWTTESYAQNPRANALRWGTLYNFRFECNMLPQSTLGPVTIGLFKPGTPTTVTAQTIVPSSVPIPLTIWLPDGPPQTVPANEPLGFDVKIIAGVENYVPGSGRLWYRCAGGSFFSTLLAPLGGEMYRATMPPALCNQTPQFYLSAGGDGGSVVTSPADAPASYYSTVMGETVVPLTDNFEIDLGWTVENVGVTAGNWERGVPAGNGSTRDPTSDYDGSGQCFVTGNQTGVELDGGPSRLISPTIDLSQAGDPQVEYAYWYYSSSFGMYQLVVEVSNDNGASWHLMDSVVYTAAWSWKTLAIKNFVTLTSQMKVRFSATDNPDGFITEAAIDAVAIRDFRCIQSCVKGDVNQDGTVDSRDISRFVEILVGGGGMPQEICAGDLEVPVDNTIDSDDTNPFVDRLLLGTCG